MSGSEPNSGRSHRGGYFRRAPEVARRKQPCPGGLGDRLKRMDEWMDWAPENAAELLSAKGVWPTTWDSNRLAAVTATKLNTPGLYFDGDGLLLKVVQGRDALTKSWVFRYRFDGKRRDMGLGIYCMARIAGTGGRRHSACDRWQRLTEER